MLTGDGYPMSTLAGVRETDQTIVQSGDADIPDTGLSETGRLRVVTGPKTIEDPSQVLPRLSASDAISHGA
jgi:hypothetical protein